MWRLLTFVCLIELANCNCPPGFELVGNECRGRESRRLTTYYDEALALAQHECNEILGHPIIMHSEKDEDYWCDLMQSTITDNTVMGILCNKTSNKWVWVDGTPVDYKPKSHGTMLDGKCLDYADYTWVLQSTCGWGAYNSHNRFTTDIFCAAPVRQPAPNGDGCRGFEDDSDDKVCYQVSGTASNWQDAQNVCTELGANLASIHNLQENNFIRRLAVSHGAVNGVFLGAKQSASTFKWADGSKWDYTNFAKGSPVAGKGDCLVMDTSTSSGLWANKDCSAKLPVVCHRPQNVKPKCGTAILEEGKLITSPGFPYSASTPCEFNLSVAKGKKVKTEINLEANPCCDFLVIHDALTGGNTIANLTGQLKSATYTSPSNTMRVSWQPKGGDNVRGMTMTYRAV